MFRLKIKLFLLVTIFSINLNLKSTDFADVEELYMNSFNPQNFDSSEKTKIEDLNNISEQKKYTQIVLDLFKLNDISTADNLVNTSKNLFKNLEILCGEHHLNSSIFNEIKRTHSFAGEISLAQILIKPIKNINELNNRQNAIKQLLNNNNFEKLNLALTEYQKYETYFLDFFDKEEFYELFNSSYYLMPKFVQSIINTINPSNTVNNKNNNEKDYDRPSFEHINYTATQNPTIINISSQFLSTIFPIWSLYNITFKLHTIPYIKAFNESNTAFRSFSYLLNAIAIPVYSIQNKTKANINDFKILKKAYYKLAKISQVIKAFNTIKEIVDSNKILKEKFTIFKPLENISSELEKLIKMLSSKTFEKETLTKLDTTLLFFINGKVLSAAYLLAKHQEELVNYIKAIGQVDAYLSIANLYKE